MDVIYREYGSTIEVTEIERDSSKIRIYAPRARRYVYGARRQDSIKRSKQICMRRVSSALKIFGSPLLLTLTLKGDASDAYKANVSLGKFQVWLRNKIAGSHSIFVPELSPRGRIHFHGLLFNVPLSYGDIRKGGRVISYGSERTSRYLASGWREGFLDAIQTDGSERLVGYITKYLTKCAGHVLFNAMHLIRISQGFPKGFEARGEYAEYMVDQIPVGSTLTYQWQGETPYHGSIEKRFYRKSFIQGS